jgi:hypothetical protein
MVSDLINDIENKVEGSASEPNTLEKVHKYCYGCFMDVL